MKTIFEDAVFGGKVWRDDNGNYGTFSAGHSFAVAMAQEIERLRNLLPPDRQPTELTAQLRAAVAHSQSEYADEWRDKPHRLVYRACEQIEMQAVEIERLLAINAELVMALGEYSLAGRKDRYSAGVNARAALARAKEQL